MYTAPRWRFSARRRPPSTFRSCRRRNNSTTRGDGLDGNEPQEERQRALRERLLQQYGVGRIEDLPVNFSGISLQVSEDGDQVFDRHYGELWDRFERQNRVQRQAGIVAPLLAVRSLSMGLAGTDFEQHRHSRRPPNATVERWSRS